MATTRFFHNIDDNVYELLDRGPFRYERELQEFFERHLQTLTGVEFLASEYSTGRHGRRIDTLGIDGAGRPVVVEYKRYQDQNVITQGLDYLVWLEDRQADFRELVRKQIGDGCVTDIDFGASRLLCVAERFPRQDQIAAAQIRRPIELIRYRRYGDAYVALEWVYGAVPEPVPLPDIPSSLPKRTVGEAGRSDQKMEFLESCDDYGKAVLSRILDLADCQSVSVRWGTKGFTLGVDVDGTRVVVCYAYPPSSVYRQSLYTALQDQRGFRKMKPPTAAEQLHEEAKRTRLFAPAGKELKCLIDRAFTDAEADTLVAWCESVVQAIRKHAVSGGLPPG